MKKLLGLMITLVIAGCTSPSMINKNMVMTKYDKDTTYNIQNNENGFDLTILYTRYQLIPESSSVATACKSQLTSIAWDLADKQNREINPINEQRIKISMGRNGITGITSCGASTKVFWLN